ncbi:hypothetical protein OY671_012969, partial [Metschnikowia pulcherrima]
RVPRRCRAGPPAARGQRADWLGPHQRFARGSGHQHHRQDIPQRKAHQRHPLPGDLWRRDWPLPGPELQPGYGAAGQWPARQRAQPGPVRLGPLRAERSMAGEPDRQFPARELRRLSQPHHGGHRHVQPPGVEHRRQRILFAGQE